MLMAYIVKALKYANGMQKSEDNSISADTSFFSIWKQLLAAEIVSWWLCHVSYFNNDTYIVIISWWWSICRLVLTCISREQIFIRAACFDWKWCSKPRYKFKLYITVYFSEIFFAITTCILIEDISRIQMLRAWWPLVCILSICSVQLCRVSCLHFLIVTCLMATGLIISPATDQHLLMKWPLLEL